MLLAVVETVKLGIFKPTGEEFALKILKWSGLIVLDFNLTVRQRLDDGQRLDAFDAFQL